MTEEHKTVLTVSECAKLLRISRGSAYEAIATNTIPHVRIGRRILIPTFALERMLQGNMQAKTAGYSGGGFRR